MKQLDLFGGASGASGGDGGDRHDRGDRSDPGALAAAGGDLAAPPSGRGEWTFAAGPRAAEQVLLARVVELTGAARRDPRLLATPVRVVVPSRSLRRHVAARLVRAAAGVAANRQTALIGVTVQTLHGLAAEVLERSGRPAPRGGLLFGTLVEREARREPLLRDALADLEDGFLGVVATVGELLDAGLEPAHAAALDEALATDGQWAGNRAAVARARAVARVAVRTEQRLRDLGLGRRSTLLRLAYEAMAAAPEIALPARAILLHGFVAAGGAAADFIGGLLRRPGSLLIIDQPPLPSPDAMVAPAVREAATAAGPAALVASPGGAAPTEREALVEPQTAAHAPFPAAPAAPAATARLAEMAAGIASADVGTSQLVAPSAAPSATRLAPIRVMETMAAMGADAEVRAIARQLRRILDPSGARGRGRAEKPDGAGELAGPGRPHGAAEMAVAPENVAIVGRDLAPYRVALRRHLRRLGIPFSGVGERGGILPAGRRAAAVLDLLQQGVEATADRWLDAAAAISPAEQPDLRLALHALGAARLHDVAALRGRSFDQGFALPIRHGLRDRRRPPEGGADGQSPLPRFADDTSPGQAALAAGGGRNAGADHADRNHRTDLNDGNEADGANDRADRGDRNDRNALHDRIDRNEDSGGNDGNNRNVGNEGNGSNDGAVRDDRDEADGRAVATRRRISERRLLHGIAVAAQAHDLLLLRPALAPAGEQLAWLRKLLGALGLGDAPVAIDLAGGPDSAAGPKPFARDAGREGSSADGAAGHARGDQVGAPSEPSPLLAAVAEMEQSIPAGLTLAAEEVRLLLMRALGRGGEVPIGGAGGGVQVLTVAEARGRTFDQLFLLGLNRDVFPRPPREDALLPDALRRVAARVLPDLALRRDAFDDERHAFAQLLSASPQVSLSWRSADEDGKPLSPSPLLQGLLPALPLAEAPPLYARDADGGGAEARLPYLSPGADRPADEHAILAGLHGSRRDFGRMLPAALWQVLDECGTATETSAAATAADVAAAARNAAQRFAPLAAGRLAVLDEMDPDLRTPEGRATALRLGPYLGFAGAASQRPLHRLYVTHLEALAACPWQLFLGRLLRIERPPDPLALLEGGDPLRLGNVVHRALDRLVRRQLESGALGGAVQSAATGSAPNTAALDGVPNTAAGSPLPVRWPQREELAALVSEAARQTLAEEGVNLPGLTAALAARALPYVEAAGRIDWSGSGSEVAVIASEVEGGLELAGGFRIDFRADREDLVAGRRRFTDYKTGKPLAAGEDPAKLRAKLLKDMRAGSRLQAAAYLLAAAPAPAEGRYLFLKPEDEQPPLPVAGIDSDDREAVEAFGAAVATLRAAWEVGTFFPRVVDPAGRDEPARCLFCDVAEACVRGDSGARRRLAEWAQRARQEPPAAGTPEAAFRAAWDLPAGQELRPEGDAAQSIEARKGAG